MLKFLQFLNDNLGKNLYFIEQTLSWMFKNLKN